MPAIAPASDGYYRRMEDYISYHGPLTVAFAQLSPLLAAGRLQDVIALARKEDRGRPPTRVSLLAAEAMAQLGALDEAYALAGKLAASYAGDPDVWNLLGWLELNRQQGAQAEIMFAKALKLHPNHQAANINAFFVRRALGSAAPAPEPKEGRVCVGTSIPPKNIGASQRCVATWLAAGFEVLSLNPPEEIAALEGNFPDVIFVPAKRDGREVFGKPLVYIADLIAALADTGADVVGILNADAALAQSGGLKNHLLEHCGDALVFCPRVDLPAPESQTAELYGGGFDAFFFGADVAPDLEPSGFCIGVPWWDLFFPYAFVLSGVRAKVCAAPLVYHLKHDQQWSTVDFYRLGLRFLQMTHAQFGGADPMLAARGCDINNLKNTVMNQSVISAQTLYSGCDPAYYDDPWYETVLAPVDAQRHLTGQTTQLMLCGPGQPSPYGRALSGN